ncbi:MAG TPA: NAD-dependent epimerase/dehydratase family protein [Vicinamibacterales bacterium]|nr:NAD-dependent epimerase/dehydratase family protein [Vicinamibacterales bacterium]
MRRRPRLRTGGGPALITGGAGFIGTNLAARLLNDGRPVRIFDNLSRPGVESNVAWLRRIYGDRVEICVGDIRDRDAVAAALDGIAEVYHFAAQAGVTTSLVDPLDDFGVNAGGTLTLLEAIRAQPVPPSLLFTSTNKVYGDLENVELLPHDTRYLPADSDTRMWGISERRTIEFHSPYGCSKGAADQYVLDYARTFGLPAVVFRLSCIYGPHQHGNEDQGWVAHFVTCALAAEPITIYGDGLQVRDLLYVDDLVDAMLTAQLSMPLVAGEAFNIGGGPERTTSLVELIKTIGRFNRARVATDFKDWREADQRYYVSDTRKFRKATGWMPTVGVRRGVASLYDWLRDRKDVARLLSTGHAFAVPSRAALP